VASFLLRGPIRSQCVLGHAQVRQCIENVLANAVQHSPDEAPITVFLRRVKRENDAAARIDIVDEGPGIASDALPHIFERFVTGKHRKGGLGLGLYLAKRIAALHNGDIAVESKPAHGARFTLVLPCYREDTASRQEPGAPWISGKNSSRHELG
jgi:signal transduction histidine kinase